MHDNPDRYLPLGDVRVPLKRKKSWISTAVTVLTVLGLAGLGMALLMPATRTARESTRRMQCMNGMKQIALALQIYAEKHGALPPAYTVDADGKPLHSWRTLILPYLDELRLYQSIDLTKPWDDPANAAACKTPVWEYQCPSGGEPANYTTYLAVVMPGSCLRAGEPRSLSEITDGARQTLMVIEVDSEHAVPWMSPVDADENVVMGIGPEFKLHHSDGVNAAFVDGGVRFLSVDLPADQRRALISIAGGDKAAGVAD